MDRITFMIEIGDGVAIIVPGLWDSKHFGVEDVNAAGHALAKQLGGEMAYWKEDIKWEDWP